MDWSVTAAPFGMALAGLVVWGLTSGLDWLDRREQRKNR